LFYNALLPSGLLISGLAFIINYFVDRYFLLHYWMRPPMYSEEMATMTLYGLFLCILSHLFVTRQFYADWTFDHVCERDDPSGSNATSTSTHVLFKCEKHRSDLRVHPSYMSADQQDLVKAYTFVCLCYAGACAVLFIITRGISCIAFCFYGRSHGHAPQSEKQGACNVKFSIDSAPEAEAYVPSVKVPGLPYQCHACPHKDKNGRILYDQRYLSDVHAVEEEIKRAGSMHDLREEAVDRHDLFAELIEGLCERRGLTLSKSQFAKVEQDKVRKLLFSSCKQYEWDADTVITEKGRVWGPDEEWKHQWDAPAEGGAHAHGEGTPIGHVSPTQIVHTDPGVSAQV